MKLNVPEIPSGYHRKDPDQMDIQGILKAADTGAEYATQIQGRIPKRYDSSHCLPVSRNSDKEVEDYQLMGPPLYSPSTVAASHIG